MTDSDTMEGFRHNPYRTFRFQVDINGIPVAGLRKMSPLKKSTEVTDWRTAGDPTHKRKLPGGTDYEPITLEQGLTMDPSFEDWANKVNELRGEINLKEFRRNLTITVLNLEGKPAIAYQVFEAWVSEYQALPDLDAGTSNAVGIQTITLTHEGWRRDPTVRDDPPRMPRIPRTSNAT